MCGVAKETIIIVHGTWAEPEGPAPKQKSCLVNPSLEPSRHGLETTRWYQIDGEFSAKINAALRERGSLARCWAHCAQGFPMFFWSGENDWTERAKAAAKFHEHFLDLQKNGWRCHVIAHSHGGNVVVDALLNDPANLSDPPEKIVTLGTPFLDTMSPILKQTERRNKAISLMTFVAISAATLFMIAIVLSDALNYCSDSSQTTLYCWTHYYTYIDMFFVSFMGLAILYYAFLLLKLRRRATRVAQPKTDLLCMNSTSDEAWRVLRATRQARDPVAVRFLCHVQSTIKAKTERSNARSRIRDEKSYRDIRLLYWPILLLMHAWTILLLVFLSISTKAEIALIANTVFGHIGVEGYLNLRSLSSDRIDSGALLLLILTVLLVLYLYTFVGSAFISAYLSPFRWLGRQAARIQSIAYAVATYRVRAGLWRFIQETALGVEGYPFNLPKVELKPRRFSRDLVKITGKLMPPGAQKRAEDRRSNQSRQILSDVLEMVSKRKPSTADINSVLRDISTDIELVHAAYYTDDECIARIADWIAGKGWVESWE